MAAVLHRDGLIFAARRKPGGDLGGRWEFPGGKVEEGEGDEAALERELLEEFGARIEGLRYLGETQFEHRGSVRTLTAYLAELSAGEELEYREHIEGRWLEPGALGGLDLAESDRKLLPLIPALLRDP